LYGCDYELFWRINPRILESFKKAYEEKIETINDYVDILAWRNGYYIAQSIGLYLGKNKKYPEKPDCKRDFAAEELKRIHEFMKAHSDSMRERKNRKKQAEGKNNG
jgi:bacillopeptidase F (M6 metalloprotease family)